VQTTVFQNGSGLQIGLVLFAAIAVFLILRLRSILGKRVGFERPPAAPGLSAFNGTGPVIEGQAVPGLGRPVPDPRSPLGERLMRLVKADPDFDPPKFLSTAEQEFRQIVSAFSAGDRQALKPLLSEGVYQTFDAAISARETAGERQRNDIKAIIAAEIEDAELMGNHAAVIVRFVSEQVNQKTDQAGILLPGTDTVSELVDLWTFEKQLGTKDPTWRLAAARSG
jgi:predicted lipid-binding transport protein (Tim44 family)